MPGIFIIFDGEGRLGRERSRLDGAAEPLLHDERYNRRTLLATDNLYFGYTYHDKYEVHAFENEACIICIDGQIYGKTHAEIERELGDLAGSAPGTANEDIAKWILSTDGEYTVSVVRTDTGEILIWNDYLARMPLYYSQTDGMLTISREVSFISAVTGSRRFNKNAIPEYLLYGYPLGNKTLFEDIYHLDAASVLRGGKPHSEAVIERLHRYNFDEKSHGPGDIRKHADNLADLLHEACRDRIDSAGRNIIALSGGLDSRSVAICLKNLKVPLSAVTFLDYFGSFSADIEYAKQISQALEIEQEMARLERAKGKDVLELLRIKGGMNYLGVSFAIPLIRRIREVFGDRITLFTGDGGDRVFRDTRPVGRVGNIHNLAAYIIAHNQMIPLEVVSEITGTDSSRLISDLEERLSGYPENDLKMKYLHFVFYERCPNWHFQGEDRNRCYVRPVTPFYSTRLFDYSMKLPDRYKEDFRLYREILVKLSPDVAAINNSEWQFPITSKKLGLYSFGRRIYFSMPPKIRRIIQLRHWYRKKLNIYDDESNIMKCFSAQLRNCEAISDHLSVEAVERNIQRIYKMGFDHLFTLTSLMEKVQGGASTLDEYLESDIM